MVWWVGRFYAQDVVDDLGYSAAEYTTLPWEKVPLEVVALDNPTEMVKTRQLLREASKVPSIQTMMQEVFSELKER